MDQQELALPLASIYGYMEALKVKPSDGLVVLDKTKFEIAPFLQQESHVKCQPLAEENQAKQSAVIHKYTLLLHQQDC